MRKIFLFFFIQLTSISFAQTTLSGVIKEQNTGVRIENVLVKSYGANQIQSNSLGSFILTFQGLKPGKNIIIRVEKSGWEIVNEKEMSTLLPDNPNEKLLTKTLIIIEVK